MTPLEPPRQAGFTLVEILITLVIAGIIASVAVPSFRDLIVHNRMSAQANELVASVSLARTAALETGSGGGVCAANAGQTGCGGSWANGWVVWADNNGNGSFDADEVLAVGSLSDQDVLGGIEDLRFDGRGRRVAPAPGAGNAAFRLEPVYCGSGKEFVRTLTVTPVGSVGIAKGNCS